MTNFFQLNLTGLPVHPHTLYLIEQAKKNKDMAIIVQFTDKVPEIPSGLLDGLDIVKIIKVVSTDKSWHNSVVEAMQERVSLKGAVVEFNMFVPPKK